MRVRKRNRTLCQHCGRNGRYELLEMLWRIGEVGPWWMIIRWLCRGCRSRALDAVQLGLFDRQLVADDVGQVCPN